ncbi:hypothetical protein K492DRAFT_223645 [Lichtheimia hyalospora FSU 10163]|nr:hypothetical protein K492DRAFT_223645 [Lichtheimia hyalospora FSU 10163]
MARFISLTLATLLSMAVFAQAAPTGTTGTDIGSQVPEQQPGSASIATPAGNDKRSNGISQEQPATTGPTDKHQKNKTEKRTTATDGGSVDEDGNQVDKRSAAEGEGNKIKEQNGKHDEHQDNTSSVPSGNKSSIGKRCNKNVAAEQGQPPVNAGEQGVASGEQGATGEQGGALEGLAERSYDENEQKTHHSARSNDKDEHHGKNANGSVQGTAGQGNSSVQKRHNKGKNGNNKQNKGAQAQGNQQGTQPGQQGQVQPQVQ